MRFPISECLLLQGFFALAGETFYFREHTAERPPSTLGTMMCMPQNANRIASFGRTGTTKTTK